MWQHFITLTGACDFLALEHFYSILLQPEIYSELYIESIPWLNNSTALLLQQIEDFLHLFHLRGPNFCQLVPPIFEASTGHHWHSWPKPPIQLQSRCSWDPVHKMAWQLSDPGRSCSWFTTPLSTSEGWHMPNFHLFLTTHTSDFRAFQGKTDNICNHRTTWTS